MCDIVVPTQVYDIALKYSTKNIVKRCTQCQIIIFIVNQLFYVYSIMQTIPIRLKIRLE